jgi:hypothetical protein
MCVCLLGQVLRYGSWCTRVEVAELVHADILEDMPGLR